MAASEGIPRPEHPRPQFRREAWVNLNGAWSFALDPGRSGVRRGLPAAAELDRTILVPFCPESELSGVGCRDFMECLWYQRPIDVPAGWEGLRVLLHFGAVDFFCEAYVDGRLAGRHWGGAASFTHDITPFVRPGGRHNLVVHVRDEVRSGRQPRGKQCPDYASRGCLYTRTTGIWQTVWMEAVHPAGLNGCHILPDLDGGRFVVVPSYRGAGAAALRATLLDGGRTVAAAEVAAADGAAAVLTLSDPKPWSPESPHLYDLRLEVLDAAGGVLDAVKSYAGLRKVHVEGGRVCLNNEPVFLRLVLDQGFYPDGIWTAPSDAALRRDIELGLRAGFNGARLHQKVFEERFHYWADRLGYLTWGEYCDWGMALFGRGGPPDAAAAGAWSFLSEWAAVIARDRNHPSIIAWTPFNETGTQVDKTRHDRRLVLEAYGLTKSLDPTRPVNDCSGWVHCRTDLWTVHDYAQDGETLRKNLTPDPVKGVMRNKPDLEPPYEGQPYFVDEIGGIKWIPPGRRPHAENSWGYGNAPRTEEEFCTRLEGIVRAIRSVEHVRGFCYTQLTDAEQEQNGIYNHDRTAKFDMGRVKKILSS